MMWSACARGNEKAKALNPEPERAVVNPGPYDGKKMQIPHP